MPSKKVYEDDLVIAFHDIQPVSPVHILLIPRKHFASMNDAKNEDWATIGHIHKIAQQLAKEYGISESGYRLINNCGKNAGQVVYHLHYHLLGGAPLEALGKAQ